MRTQLFALVVLVALAVAAAQQQSRVFTNREEYLRSKAEYDQQKKVYDQYQALTNVPVVPGYDLITKTREADEAPGRAEQLLPTYTGMQVNFQESSGPGTVEPGNTVQNYFHKGAIPEKTEKTSGKPVVIPTAPGQDFVVPQDDAVSAAPAPAPAAAPAPAPAQQALFFGSGALSVTSRSRSPVVQADAPFPASVRFAPLPAAAPVPIRPLSHQFQFAPSLPHSDFHPGPARAVPPVDTNFPVAPFVPAPFVPSAAPFALRTFRAAERYGEPGVFIRR